MEPNFTSFSSHKQLQDTARIMVWLRSWFGRESRLDEKVCDQDYAGKGTIEDPFVIDFLHDDGQDALGFSKGRKMGIAVLQVRSSSISSKHGSNMLTR